jgi:hypothetical protein
MHTHRKRASRVVFAVVELCAAFVFFWVVLHHVYTFDFKPLAALCVPILVVFFGFASLLYNRGRALPKGEAQTRSLYAAERAMQATLWYLFGIVLGVSLYGLLVYFGLSFNPRKPSAAGLWLLVFLAPYALMQAGLLFFMRAAWVITPQFFRRIGAFELRRRIRL